MAKSVAVITGASRGIGRAIAIELARDGADIVAVSRGTGDLESLEAQVKALGLRFLSISADLSSAQTLTDVVEQAWEWQGRISTLVNAAGVLIRKAESATTPYDWDRTIAVNARAPYFLTQNFGARMHASGGGSIVSIASIAGQHVTGAPAPYQASKAALIQLTRFFANRLAPLVRVNAIGPGYVRTELAQEWLADPLNEEWVKERTPLGRIAVPEDVAGVAAFLASDRARYVTGQHLLVDGGWSIR